MAKVIIDANIIIFAAFGGKPLEAVLRATSNHEVCISREIQEELTGVVSKLSRKLTEDQQLFIHDKIRNLIEMATLVVVSTAVALSRDATDDHYLSLCKETRADFLLTGDKDLLDIPEDVLKQEDIPTRIVNPRRFLEEVTSIKQQ
jgi:uncharacterized protein